MSNWIALSEILRNVALTFAAIVGALLAWRQYHRPHCKQGQQMRKQNWPDVRM